MLRAPRTRNFPRYLSWRHASWILPALLVVLPLLLYSNTVFAEFGLRDDYSILREAHEEPTKVLKGCTAQARPIYGVLLESSFAQFRGIPDLALGRACAALLLGATAAVSALILSRLLLWPLLPAILIAALFTMLPGAQVIVSWSICWPFALATLFSVISFSLIQSGWSYVDRRLRFGSIALGFLLLIAATLIYPSETLLYLVFVAGLIPLGRDRGLRERAREIAWHLVMVGAALGAGFAIVQLCYLSGSFYQSPRVAFETHWAEKVVWLCFNPIKDALGLFVLDDLYGRTDVLEDISIAATISILLAGCALEFKRHGWRSGVLWSITLIVLPLAALCINVIAAERWAPYRTLYAASGVILVFAVMAARNCANLFTARPDRWISALMVIAVLAAGIAARRQTWELIARPQMEELRLVREGSSQIDPSRAQEILILRPFSPDTTLPIIFDDEFGSLSSNSEWTPQEMIKEVLLERFPGIHNVKRRYRMVVEWWQPAGKKKWDVIVDLRNLAHASSVVAQGQ